MSAMPEAALIGGLPRTPITGDALQEDWEYPSGGQR